jgi:hypothetical protein
MFIKKRRKIIVTVVHVDSWKKQSREHMGALNRRLWFVEEYQHIPRPDLRASDRAGMPT